MTAPGTVVFVHSSNELFGADRILLQVVDSLRAAPGLRPVVWLPDDVTEAPASVRRELVARGVETRVRGLPILRRAALTPAALPGLIARTLATWAALRRTRPDVLVCATSAALLVAPLARLAGVRTVLLHAQEIWSGPEARVLGALARSCDGAIAISGAVARSLAGAVRTRVRVIENAVDDPPGARPIAPGEREPVFLVASRWNAWKGHATLLAAWDSIEPPPGRLVVAGSAPEIGAAVDVRALVAGLRHPLSVEIVGQVDDLTALVDTSDVMVVPSDEPEPFGLVAIEAFRRQRGVIATDGGGLADIVRDGVTGRLVPRRDPLALARALTEADVSTAARWGAAARADFVERYALERFEREFAAVWKRVAARTSARRG